MSTHRFGTSHSGFLSIVPGFDVAIDKRRGTRKPVKPCLRTCQLLCLPFVTPSVLLVTAVASQGQDNYEIQVYGSDTVPAGRTMVELHSNYTVDGEREVVNSVLPS